MTARLTEQDKQTIVLAYHQKKKSVTEITREMFVSYGTVYRVLRKESAKHGYTFGGERRRFLIREDYANGMEPKDIAMKYGISRTTVYGCLYTKEYGGRPERRVVKA